MVNTKKCIGCKDTKPLNAFHKQYNSPDGYRYDCKDCHINYQKIFRRGKGYEREWRKRDWSGYLEKVRAYRKTAGGYYSSFKYRKYKLDFTRAEFVKWDSLQKRECFYCGIPEELMLSIPDFHKKRGAGVFHRLTIDRKDNLKGYSLENIVLACPPCNSTKGDLFNFLEFKEIAQKHIRPKWESINSTTYELKLYNELMKTAENRGPKEKKAFKDFLSEDEELVLATGFGKNYMRHKFAYYSMWPGGILLAIGFGLAYYFQFNLGVGLLAGFIAASLYALAQAVWHYHANRYLLTTRRVIIKKGLLSVNLTSALYDKITHIEVEQGVLDRLIMKHGNIIVNTAGGNKDQILISAIDEPIQFKNLLERLINRERERFSGQNGPVVTGELVD